MFLDGLRFCDTLEDTDRGLRSDMLLSEIKAKKKYGITAIPTGRYKVKMTYWGKYRKYYPELCNVPGYTSILIHGGKNATATLGCVLVGENKIKGGLITLNHGNTSISVGRKPHGRPTETEEETEDIDPC